MAAASNAPPGTFLPGTKVQVGNQRVVIDRYLSEGGFAHVYVVTLAKPVDGHEKAVLKRVAVPDKEHLANMRTEVETMKRLRGRKYIVKYIDSHASSLKQGGYEVFLLMEWCNGGGLIDFMNTRLQNRLTEPEIVKIFTDVAEGVACMHYLSPPLMHRDIKVENVLITLEGKTKTFKLCDFGSAAPARPAATNAAEGRLIEDDIQRHTTLQYRSPEMIDVWRKQPIDEKSDVWALGCFLYKLCYYTTPFEEVGQMAILNASFKYPGYPKFSDDLKLLIASMLRESPSQRPNIYQLLAKACKMDGRPLSLRDNYTGRTQSEDTRNQQFPQPGSSQSRAGASLAPPKPEPAPVVPQIEPMRRGRPTKPVSHHNSAKPSPSPLRILDHADAHHADAFSGLDHANGKLGDDLSSKYPKLEEFSLMSDHGSKFAFEQSSKSTGADPDLAKRVTEALADEAFARPRSPPKQKPTIAPKPDISRSHVVDRKEFSNPKTESLPQPTTLPQRSRMVDHGTSASPPPSMKHFSDRPVWKVPEKTTLDRSATVTQASSRSKPVIAKDKAGPRLSSLLREDAARSQLGHDEGELRPPTSSRPSLEGGRPLLRDLDSGVHRSRSLNMRTRPVSVNMGAHPTHIKDQEIKRTDIEPLDVPADMSSLTQTISDQPHNRIESDLDFLRAREEEERERHKHFKRLSGNSKHHKRSSLPSAAFTGTKNILQGRFGEAFRVFEGHEHGHHSPAADDGRVLTPIAGSEATDLSDDRRAMDETEELSPELRRELEKQKLEAEERRVERAAAEYRQKIASTGGAVPPPPASAKAASIQNRVQSLLQENEKPAQRTATGYGRFTPKVQMQEQPRIISDMPVSSLVTGMQSRDGRPLPDANQARIQRPSAPPKPQVLRTGATEEPLSSRQPVEQVPNGDDWEEFSNKYPSLSRLEMVENDAESQRPQPPTQRLRMKEV